MNFSKLTDYLDRFYAEKNIPGLGMAVYYKQKPVFEHYAGFSDVENQIVFGPDTIFRLYSATKVMTCAALLQLLEAGAFKLSDPLYAYIPEYRDMAVRHSRADGSEELRPARNPITIEHLFSMTAGIDRRDTEETDKAIKASGGEGRTLDVIRALATEPLLFEPGTHFKYGACHDVLGALIEVLSGKTLGTYLKAHIFDRIGMRDTSFVLKDDKRFCKLYNNFNGKTHTAESIGETFNVQPGRAYESGGGGLFSTVSDYILFAAALCNYGLAPNGERILRPETVNEMRRGRLGPQAQQDFAKFGGVSKSGYSYALGVRTLVDREDNNALSHNGEFGWDGARGCYVVIDPEAEVALFYAQQEGGSPWYRWHGTIRNYVYASVWEA
ncbi:beta-lactamase family protein [Paenibacillus lycopersici]|uniref:Beta-lactamase family protein n=1 Tax=Paenibacillus lycopersici TaxID=2704462 RepID=A0A6C0FYJ6_9BACL|nr:serine hydrolase domain-containing protein [Paenibacillus lycopersici]QHT61152.1 beta-lactamase family protein [Paenibacillus lycopersici]